MVNFFFFFDMVNWIFPYANVPCCKLTVLELQSLWLCGLWRIMPLFRFFILGVEKLVHHFHKHNIPMAVATGSGTQAYDRKISNHKHLFQLISHVVKSDDPELQQCKPAPDIFLLASARFPTQPTSPDHVLVFEDAPNGVTAARAAGMNVVMVPDKNMDKAKCANASMVLKSLEEFDPGEWGFPPF